MGPAEMDEGLPGISICPRCGARLVTKNLWHSCGTFTLDGLFPTSAHFVIIRAESDLDDQLRAWLQESHDIVGMQSDLRRQRRSRLPVARQAYGDSPISRVSKMGV